MGDFPQTEVEIEIPQEAIDEVQGILREVYGDSKSFQKNERADHERGSRRQSNPDCAGAN